MREICTSGSVGGRGLEPSVHAEASLAQGEDHPMLAVLSAERLQPVRQVGPPRHI
jgi:hypothetical protein